MAADASQRSPFFRRTGRWKSTFPELFNELAVTLFAAYGWDAAISDDELLAKLLALNLERARAEELAAKS